MLTLFAVPRYFRERFATIWRSATLSWTRFTARPGILLFRDEEGAPDIASELGLRHFSGVTRNEFGAPLLDDLFRGAELVHVPGYTVAARESRFLEIVIFFNAGSAREREFLCIPSFTLAL